MLNDNDNLDSLAKFCEVLKEYGILPTEGVVELSFHWNEYRFCILKHNFNIVNGSAFENYECVIKKQIIGMRRYDKSIIAESLAFGDVLYYNCDMNKDKYIPFSNSGDNHIFLVNVGMLREYISNWIKELRKNMVTLEKMQIEEEKNKVLDKPTFDLGNDKVTVKRLCGYLTGEWN